MKRIKIAQWRVKGLAEGVRIFRQISGEQLWHMHYWVKHTDGNRDDHTLRNDAPCALRHLSEKACEIIAELTQGSPTVIDGGWDCYMVKA